jgi:hypothetical protein
VPSARGAAVHADAATKRQAEQCDVLHECVEACIYRCRKHFDVCLYRCFKHCMKACMKA